MPDSYAVHLARGIYYDHLALFVNSRAIVTP